MEEKYNSHIQISKCILKNFLNNKQNIYLDFSDDNIKEDFPDKLGTSLCYYYRPVEKYLSKEIESKVGNNFKDIIDFSNNNIKELNIYNIKNIKKFVEYSIIRGKRYLETAKSKIKLDIPDSFLHNILVYSHCYFGILDNYYTTIFINKTNKNFITLSNTIYYLTDRNNNCWVVLPISPRVCIVFSKTFNNIIKENKCNDVINRNCSFQCLIDDKDIVGMNKQAIISEKITSNSFIVGDIDTLKELKNYKKYIDELIKHREV